MLQSLLPLIASHPWLAILPLLVLALMNGVLGYLTARKRGEAFSTVRFADFLEHSVGANQIMWIAGSVATVYLSQGSSAAVATLLALGGISGISYAKVAADSLAKIRILVGREVDPKLQPLVLSTLPSVVSDLGKGSPPVS